MPSSHTAFLTHHGGKQAAKKRIWKFRSLISHVRCQILESLCCFSCGSHKIMATEMLLVCGEDSNRFGPLEHSILRKTCFLLWNSRRDSASFLLLWLLTLQLSFRSSFKKHFRLFSNNASRQSKSICCFACEKRISLPYQKVCEYKVDLPTRLQTQQRGE